MSFEVVILLLSVRNLVEKQLQMNGFVCFFSDKMMQVIIGKSLYLRRIDDFCVMTLDEDLMESLFYRYSQRMENFAAHILGDAAAAEDVVQDSFVKLYSKYRGKDEKNFAPLLFTVLRNSCKDTLRRRLSKGNVITTDFSDITESEKLYSSIMLNGSGDALIYDELVKEVEIVLSSLPDRCREIFVMSRIDGLKNKEIAFRLGITEQAVKNQISKALKILRAAITLIGLLFFIGLF